MRPLHDTIELLERIRDKRNLCRAYAHHWRRPESYDFWKSYGYDRAADRLNKKLCRILSFADEDNE